MNVLGIGPMEMGIIAVVALLIFGPGKLPEVMGQAGKMVRDFRRMSAELTGEFEKTIAEAKDMGNSITSEIGGMTKEVNSVTNSVKKDLGLKGATATSKSKATSGTKSTGTKTTSTAKTGAKPASTPTTTAASKRAPTPSSTTATKTSPTSTTSTAAAARKPVTPAATRDDPDADMSLFEPKPVERVRRSRKATPSIISDPTPHFSGPEPAATSSSRPAGDQGRSWAAGPVADGPLNRARQRRRAAGYARTSA